jgi:hypothetical protein
MKKILLTLLLGSVFAFSYTTHSFHSSFHHLHHSKRLLNSDKDENHFDLPTIIHQKQIQNQEINSSDNKLPKVAKYELIAFGVFIVLVILWVIFFSN